ncbi:MAG: 50S ribosomal protein L4 [Candidatus Lokiarchaeota archaeon]|nr:50S ribosomal protein L4 [Candidatus Lokiarchaeota archaeon]
MSEKFKVIDLEGKVVREIDRPAVFLTQKRPDIIKRAYLSSFTGRIQPKGTDPWAGKRTTAESWGTGRGVSRVPRVKGGGTRRAQQGGFISSTVGGRACFPPLPEKKLKEKINDKERILAIKSAIAITGDKKLVSNRGHVFFDDVDFPIIITDEIESLKKTREVRNLFIRIGVWGDVLRASKRKVRSGKGKMRGRKYKKKKSILIVVNENKGIYRAARNHPGVDICEVKMLNAELLAPGGHIGRLTVWSESAINALDEFFP